MVVRLVIAFFLLAVSLVVLFDLVFRPTRRRLAFRNIARRRGEALLVVLGAMLGTAIITSSFVVGDSFSASIVDAARTNLGPIDEVVRVEDTSQLEEVSQALRDPRLPGTDGALDAKVATVAVATRGEGRRAIDSVSLVEVDFDQARAFGGDEEATGMASSGITPSGDEVVINERVARELDVDAGDQIEVFAFGTAMPMQIRQIIPELGLAGAALGQSVAPVFVAGGTIDVLRSSHRPNVTDRFDTQAQPPAGVVLLSNNGDVFSGVDASNSVEAAVKERIHGNQGVEVNKTKQGLLDSAKRRGDSVTQLFGGIGYFSVAAGLLLLVNLFIMLADERKTEMGMLRALGFKRTHIMRTFGMEGAIYAAAAAIVGGIVGIGVGAGITRLTNSIFNGDNDNTSQVLSVKPTSVSLGMLIGFGISLITVIVTSLVISRFNIILAIRDLPRAKTSRRRSWLINGAVLATIGGLVAALGISQVNGIATILGPALVAFGVILVVDRKMVTVVASLFVVGWSILVFGLLPDVMDNPGINTFVVEGLTLVAAAVIFVMQLDRVWRGLANRLAVRGRGVAARLSIADPLARRLRTGLLVGMFALVVFTLTFLSAFAEVFAAQAPQLTSDVSGGFDIMMDANPTNPVPLEEVRALDGVADAAGLWRGTGASYTTRFRSNRPNVTTGISEDFLRYGAPTLGGRLSRYPDDAAAFRAVVHDPSLVIVPTTFLLGGGTPPTTSLKPGDQVTVTNRSTEESHELTVVGVFDRELLGNGAVVGAEFARRFLAPQIVQSRYYVKATPGTDAEQVARSLQGRLVPNGVHAETFAHRISVTLSQNHTFFSLLRGYLGLGLLIGIAGLGVVMVRAVRERRRQIGMLRAMGFSTGVVRRSFLMESTFLALQGILLGILLGSVTSYQLMTQSDVFGELHLPYQLPLAALGLILVVPLLGALLATVIPANRAARIKPAVALRIAE